MSRIGLREWVALGALALAGLFGFLFFDPTSTDGGNDPPATISLGGAPNSPTPLPPSTPTPIPVVRLQQPQGAWLVFYFETLGSGGEVRTGEGFAPKLDFDVPGRPFPDVRDDAWRVEASQQVELPAGRYAFTLETDGAVKVWAGDSLLVDEPDAPTAQRREVLFDHAGGGVSFRIELRDTGGPVKLRWVE